MTKTPNFYKVESFVGLNPLTLKQLAGVACSTGFFNVFQEYLTNSFLPIKETETDIKNSNELEFQGIKYHKIDNQLEDRKYFYDKKELEEYLKKNQ